MRPDFSRREWDVLDILEVHDGDTYRLLLDTGFEHSAFPWLRLKDYSCPELDKPGGHEAQDAAATLLMDHRAMLWVVTYRIPLTLVAKMAKKYGDSKRSFARYVADVYLDDNQLLGGELVQQGHARPGAFVN